MSASNTTASRILILVPATMSCLLSACAVLSVDVDVYKGPLMNEARVQMLQLLSIGEGAKPLLVSLRDGIEWRDEGGKKPEGISGYQDDYIENPAKMIVTECSARQQLFTACKKGAQGFRNPMAERVNEVLQWYHEIPNSDSRRENKRLDEEKTGLDDLFRDYKKALSKPSSLMLHDQDLQNVQDKVMDGLAQFSVKILFLANHDGLLADPDSQGWISGGLGNLSRGLFGDSVTEAFSPMVYFDNFQGKGTLAGRKRLQYVRLLQAVGNSILLSVNELREQETARKGGDIRAKAEKAAIEAAFSGDPFRVYVNLIRELGEEKKGQASLGASLQSLLEKIDQDMNRLEGKAAEKTDSSEWITKQTTAKKRYVELHGQLEGVLQLLEPDKLTSVLSTRTQPPKDAADAWTKLLELVPSILKDDKLSANAKEHLDSIKDKLKLEDAAKISYVKVWEVVKTHLVEERKVLSEAETDRNKFEDLIALFEQKGAKSIQKKVAEEKANVLQVTETVVKAEKSAVLDRLAKQDVFVSGRGVYLTLATHLRTKLETDNNKADIQTALDELNRRVPPPDFAIAKMSTLNDAKAVLDYEIAFLRQEHIQAVRVGGEDADAVGIALDALEVAAQHRAGMVRLRPAAAYLRTSYPSTSLQDDPNLTWDNLLLQQGLRNIPFSSYVADLFNPQAGHDRAISADLDKQYWQNINRVRVSGAGKTNYVLAKDDVGNWYVKQYFGDTARIFESARKLGMYNLAPTLGTGLLASLKDKQAKAGGSSEDPQSTPLKRVFEKHQSVYSSKTTADVTALKELAEKDVLAMKIREGWESLPDLKGEDETLKKIKDGLTSPVKKLKDRIAEIEKDDKTRDGVRVIQEIQAIRDFHTTLTSGIESLDLPIPVSGSLSADNQEATTAREEKSKTCANGFPDPCAAATRRQAETQQHFEAEKSKHDRTVKDRVEKVVLDVLRNTLSDLVQGRQRLLQDYEQAILFVGDASKN